MKFLENYYYVMKPIGLLLLFSIIRYLFGDSSALNIERIIICIVGGFVVGTLGNMWDIYKSKKQSKLHESE